MKVPRHLQVDLVHRLEQVSLGKQDFKDASKYTHTVGVMLLIAHLTNVAISLFLPIWHLFILLQPDILKIYINEDQKIYCSSTKFLWGTNVQSALSWLPKATISQTYLDHNKLGHFLKMWRFWFSHSVGFDSFNMFPGEYNNQVNLRK